MGQGNHDMKKVFWNEYVSLGAMTISISALILSMVVPGHAGTPGSNGVHGSNGVNGTNGVDGTNGNGFFLLVVHDIGGFVGSVNTILNVYVSTVYITMSLTIQPSILTMIENNPLTSNLDIRNVAGFIGFFSELEPLFNQMTMDNVLINFHVHETLRVRPVRERVFVFSAFGDNTTPFFKIIARDVYVFTNLSETYGQGVYPFQLVQEISDLNAYMDQLNDFASSPMWAFEDDVLTLQFFSLMNTL
jgi:hypothetical protein